VDHADAHSGLGPDDDGDDARVIPAGPVTAADPTVGEVYGDSGCGIFPLGR
jgi:hypothetical protein